MTHLGLGGKLTWINVKISLSLSLPGIDCVSPMSPSGFQILINISVWRERERESL